MFAALYRGSGLVSAAIRWQTRGAYSHVATVFADGLLIEAHAGRGVIQREYDPVGQDRNAELFEIEGITVQQIAKAREFMLSEVGCGYDYWGIIRFISRRHMPKNERWFCSELFVAAMRLAGNPVLSQRLDDAEASPRDVSISPILFRKPQTPTKGTNENTAHRRHGGTHHQP